MPNGELARSVQLMSGSLEHRGPDDEGCWVDEQRGVALGFQRLSIIDLSLHGHQPMHSPSGRYTLVFNGEIYNYRLLRQELRSAGVRYEGDSDTSVVVAAFDAWGIRSAVQRFNGMFAMAVWDRQEGHLTLVRDRLGIKPLFIHWKSGLFTFGSELRAIMHGPAFQATIDRAALRLFLRYLYVPAPQAILENVHKLPPGHLLTVCEPNEPLPRSEPFWSLDRTATHGVAHRFDGDPQEAVEHLEELLRDSVSQRMQADVPLGALLSGGVDSSVIVGLMSEIGTRRVRTFSIGFDSDEHDESSRARQIAAHFSTEHTSLRIGGKEALAVVPDLGELLDEPMADPSFIPTWLVSHLARQHVTVALSGDGGDELFGGYNRYLSGSRLIPWFSRLPRPVRRALGHSLRSLEERLPTADSDSAYTQMLGRFSGRPSLLKERLGKTSRMFAEDSECHLYRSLLSAWNRPEDVVRHALDATPTSVEHAFRTLAHADLTDRMMLADQLEYLPDDLLAKVDRASMAVSLEVRVPILDHRVVEFSWTLPRRYKLSGPNGKWILREVLAKRLPGDMMPEKKIGFTVPLAQWLRGPLREWAEDMLSHDRLEGDGILVADRVQREWRALLEGRTDQALTLWAVLIFQIWHGRWLASGSHRPASLTRLRPSVRV
jgi:asparagine synthase (glutamine-hydrolysing)